MASSLSSMQSFTAVEHDCLAMFHETLRFLASTRQTHRAPMTRV